MSNIIVIGASAGGVEALLEIVRALPRDLQAAIFVVVHVSAESPSVLPQILAGSGELKSSHARDGDPIEPGHIYVAPPDYHLLVEPGRIRVTHGPRESRHRPAIDPLFRTAARAYGPRVLGILLSGNLADGTVGLQIIKAEGGTTMVQDPNEALFASMPENALRTGKVDFVLPLREIAPKILELVRERWKDKVTALKSGLRTPEGEKNVRGAPGR